MGELEVYPGLQASSPICGVKARPLSRAWMPRRKASTVKADNENLGDMVYRAQLAYGSRSRDLACI